MITKLNKGFILIPRTVYSPEAIQDLYEELGKILSQKKSS